MLLQNTFLLKRFVALLVLAGLVAFVAPSVCPAQENSGPKKFTEKDRESILKMFSDTQERYNKAITGLSDSQMSFRKSEKSWTIAQVAEHIMIAEGGLRQFIDTGALKSPLNKDPKVKRISDGAIMLAVTNRNQKFQAPPVVQPKSSKMKIEELIAGMSAAREKNVRFLKSTKLDLRNHFAPNPLIGDMDAYQWFVFMNAHAERHLAQIEEIKAHKDYPKN